MVEDDRVQEIKEWIGDNDTKLKILERLVEYEKNNEPSTTFEDRTDRPDWEPGSDVSMQPAYMGMIKTAPFTKSLLDTGNNTVLAVREGADIERAVNELNDEPDEWSDDWLENELGGNKIDQRLEDIEVTQEDADEISEILDSTNALDYWSKYVIPDLKHRDRAKKAILLVLASPEDKYGTKGRVNMLAYGPPGTGKSVIKNFLVDKFDAESIDGPRVSKADITYNKSSDEFGQLPKAHKGVLVVEESDEMDEKPLGASLTSLGESGKIEIRDMEIPAEVRGVFLSNFESVDEAIEQWSEESVNRFDFTIEFDRLDEDTKDDVISWHYEYFRQPKPSENEELFMKYLKVCRSHTPSVAEPEKIDGFKKEHISEFENVREGISVMNIAWTVARLNLSDVTLEHYATAFDLVTQ